MRLVLLTLMFLMSSFAFSETVEKAKDLFNKRGQDSSFAMQAAEIYENLAENTQDDFLKATYLNGASNAYYYVGTHTDSNIEKKRIHTIGLNKASQAIDIFRKSNNDEVTKNELALALFRYGANLGKWGEANGVAASLSKWPSLKSTMHNILSLNKKETEWFGANRILGRAYYKLPFPLGSKKKSYNYLKEAFDNTKFGNKVSVHGLNNLYLADLLVAVGKKEQAKKLLEEFISVDPETLCPERIPETKEEIQLAKKKLESL